MNTLSTLAASAGIVLATTFSAQAERINTEGPFTCEGQMFGGDYLAIQHPSFAPITADTLNLALQDSAVKDISVIGGGVLHITPVNPGTDCEAFMQDLMDTNLFKSVEPNAILGIGGPAPGFY